MNDQEKYKPWVRFEIPSPQGEEGFEYQEFLLKLLGQFAEGVDPAWKGKAIIFARLKNDGYWNGEESRGGINLVINGSYARCKLLKYDGAEAGRNYGTNPDLRRGLLFREHDDPGAVRRVFLLANAFEDFLKSTGIVY